MGQSAKDRLRRFYTQFSGEDQVLIPINADPDAIAGAMAAKRLLWRKTAGVTISNINVIERPDNLTLIRLSGISMIPYEKLDIGRFSRFVMVDSQPAHHDIFKQLKPQVIIDHHPIASGSQAPFVDIRPRYGATATILTEYLRAAHIKPSAKLATALYYAIKTDTSNFERQTSMEDINAFQFAFRHCNIALARRIETAEMRVDALKFFKKALDELRIRKGRAFVHLGGMISPDVCVQIADFIMRIDSVNWSIVSGRYNRKLVIIIRNDGIRKNAGKLAKQSFGRFGSAGGHKSSARAEVPLEVLAEVAGCGSERTRLGDWVIAQIEKRADVGGA